jgi:hypothetical protein
MAGLKSVRIYLYNKLTTWMDFLKKDYCLIVRPSTSFRLTFTSAPFFHLSLPPNTTHHRNKLIILFSLSSYFRVYKSKFDSAKKRHVIRCRIMGG